MTNLYYNCLSHTKYYQSLAIKLIIFFLILATYSVAIADINVYSARKEHLIRPILNKFTEQTGIKTMLLTGKADALLERIKSEGKHSPADILITTDIARLYKAKSLGLFDRIDSDDLLKNIPKKYRDDDKQWFGLSVRSRVILVSKERVTEKHMDYESLASTKWKGKICVRSSNNVYNQSMVASFIAHRGETDTLKWIKGLVNNFARKPSGGDRDQILLVASGVCDIAIANTYYLALMLNSDDPKQREAANKVRLILPNQDKLGAHINISGAGILNTSKNKSEAQQLLEYLIGKEAQTMYSNNNFEYPVHPAVKPSELLQKWGAFKADDTVLSRVGELNETAVRLMNQGGWL